MPILDSLDRDREREDNQGTESLHRLVSTQVALPKFILVATEGQKGKISPK